MISAREARVIQRALESPDWSVSRLAVWLYEHGRWPTNEPSAKVAGEVQATVVAAVGERSDFDTNWEFSPPSHNSSPWLAYQRPNSQRTSGMECAEFKAYVSLSPNIVCSTFREILSALTAKRCIGFKIAVLAEHVCRPDSFVVYAGNADDLNGLMESLFLLMPDGPKSDLLFAASTDCPNVFWAIDRPGTSWRRMACWHAAAAAIGTNGNFDVKMRGIAREMHLLGICPQRWLPHSFLRTAVR